MASEEDPGAVMRALVEELVENLKHGVKEPHKRDLPNIRPGIDYDSLDELYSCVYDLRNPSCSEPTEYLLRDLEDAWVRFKMSLGDTSGPED